MKKIISFLISISISVASFAQGEATKDMLGKIALTKDEYISGVMAQVGNNYIVIKHVPSLDVSHLTSTQTLFLIDEKGTVIKSNTLKADIDTKKFTCRMPVSFVGKTYMIGTVNTLKDEPTAIYLYEIDLATLEFTGSPIKVCSYSNGYKYYGVATEGNEYLKFHEMGCAVSPDNKFIAFVTKSEYLKEGKEKHHIALFTDELKTKYEKDVVLNYPDNQFIAENVFVDTAGVISLSGNKVIGEDYVDKEFHIICFGENGGKMTDMKIANVGMMHQEAMVAGNKIIVTGMAFNEVKKKKELFLQLINPTTNTIELTKTKAFDEEFLKFVFGSEYKQGAMINDVYIKTISFRDDGGMYVTGESSGSYQSTMSNYSTMSSGSVLIYSISPSYEIEWVKMAKKYMVISASYYAFSGYAEVVHDNNLILIYNDHPKNVTDFNAENSFTPYVGCITKTTIDPSGNIKKSILFDHKEGVQLRTEGVETVNGGKKLFLSLKDGGGDLFGVIPLK